MRFITLAQPPESSSLIIWTVTLLICSFQIQGDENDPDQQSDSEEGSTKGEPQVTQIKTDFQAGALQPGLVLCGATSVWFLPFCFYSLFWSFLMSHLMKSRPKQDFDIHFSAPVQLWFPPPPSNLSFSPFCSLWIFIFSLPPRFHLLVIVWLLGRPCKPKVTSAIDQWVFKTCRRTKEVSVTGVRARTWMRVFSNLKWDLRGTETLFDLQFVLFCANKVTVNKNFNQRRPKWTSSSPWNRNRNYE